MEMLSKRILFRHATLSLGIVHAKEKLEKCKKRILRE